MTASIFIGCCLTLLPTLPDQSVNTCITSPPYWGLRDYGHTEQIGHEKTPDDYIASMVKVFGEVRRVLRDDGTLWLNLGDTYLPGKRLAGIPWRVALALQDDGWRLRQDIIWHKTNAMPEKVTDRPTKAHEYLFLLSKGDKYHYDAAAIREESAPSSVKRAKYNGGAPNPKSIAGAEAGVFCGPKSTAKNYGQGKNKRSVWSIATQPFREAHFATFPPSLIEPCVLAGCPEGGTVLDPFFGAGTTGLVADRLGRDCIGIELNPDYAAIARKRLGDELGMFASLAAG